MPQNAIKIVIPALIALAAVSTGFYFFWNGMVQSALMGASSEYGPNLPEVKQGDPHQSYLCHPGAPNEWIGCFVTK